ncbi:MAG: bifunctional hydroxymethylpyrimidine kinase/phosphomethylpyrimidine kinase [Thermoflexales bacterium]|nr:bifunctional hydroxymethylpyrimidine kinase/phosphomethylpyrimidine kinase [Thermoflexales bacterium]
MSDLKRALTIAGSDSGGGAGIQADLKTFGALGVYGMSVLTALTAQNTLGVQGVFEVPPQFVSAQIDSVLGDLGADAVKTGMLSNAAIVEAVAEGLRRHAVRALVVDPVMVAKSGDPLLREDACSALVERLLPLATVVTPNLPEAGVLTGASVVTLDDMREAARRIHALGPAWVVVKGGHLQQAGDVVDLLFDGQAFHEYRSPRLETRNTHGTGCTFASAIAAGLAKGLPVVEAVSQAKTYLASVLYASAGLCLGTGPHGPMHHFVV